jgi:hypothetical protein
MLYILAKVAILIIKGDGNTEGGRIRQRREGSTIFPRPIPTG